MKAVLYCRVSSKDQEEHGFSLPAQEKFLKEYAAKKDLEITKIFAISESASGRKQREVFSEMMQYVIDRDLTVVVCEKVDRLTRNFKDAVAIDEWLEDDENRQVHLVKDSLVLHKNSRSQEKLNWGIRILFAKNYIDNLSEEVKKGLAEKLRQGWLPTKPPVGYRTVGEKGRKIHVIDDEKAPIMRKMFELYATGNYSVDAISKRAHTDGLRNMAGKKIWRSRVAVLLSDPFYIGKIRYNGAIHPGAHEPLISEDLFNKVQELMHGNGAPRQRKHSPLFKALLRCVDCNRTITWEQHKGHWYGHCNRYGNCPHRKYVRQEKVEEQLLDYLDGITIKSPRLVEWIKKALKNSHADEMVYNESSRNELQKRYAATQRRIDSLYDDKIDGKISEDFYRTKFQQYSQEKEGVVNALKRLDTANTRYYELGASVIDLAHRARAIYSNEKTSQEDRRVLLSIVFSNLKLNGQKLEVSYSKAFGILSDFSPIWNKSSEPANVGSNTAQMGDLDTQKLTLLRG